MAISIEPPSNFKSYAIFGGYMATALVLTLRCISIIRRQSRGAQRTTAPAPAAAQEQQQVITTTNLLSPAQLRQRVWVFSALAALSLGTTWYYMFAFFAHSYRAWAAVHHTTTASAPHHGGGIADLQLGAWLRDTSLFSEAWASAMASGARVWWTQQIFGFCSLWTLVLATEGALRTGTTTAASTPRRALTLWPFILLGQVVAISFAANLSFLAILLSGPRVAPRPLTGRAKWDANSRTVDPATFWGYAIVGLTFASVAATLPAAGAGEGAAAAGSIMSSPTFLPLLLTPHVLAFAPLMLRKYIRSATQLAQPSLVAVVMAILLQTRTTGGVLEHAAAAAVKVTAGGDGVGAGAGAGAGMAAIAAAFYEHPAVSSVGWDVVMCWTSFTCWALLRD
ncbi:hypothetical protein MN608_07365 [Microdochium nivale]|nr:hypothetical protein MN608_07365 [Microdochium nivale]